MTKATTEFQEEIHLWIRNDGPLCDQCLVTVVQIEGRNEKWHADSLPLAIPTVNQVVQGRSGRFKLSNGQEKKLILCWRATANAVPPLPVEIGFEDGRTRTLPGGLGARYVFSLGVHGLATNVVKAAIAVEFDGRLTASLMSPSDDRPIPLPSCANDLLSLPDAARNLYSEARQNKWLLAAVAERLSGESGGDIAPGSPEDILDFVATFVGPRVVLYGSRPPSDRREVIPSGDVASGQFEEGALILKTHRHVYTDLAITKTDYAKVLSELASWRT